MHTCLGVYVIVCTCVCTCMISACECVDGCACVHTWGSQSGILGAFCWLSLATLSSVSHWTASFPVQWGWPASRLWDPSVSTSRCWERIQPCSAFNMSVSDSNTGPHGQSKQSQPLSYCPCSQLYILNRELSHKGNKKYWVMKEDRDRVQGMEKGIRPLARFSALFILKDVTEYEPKTNLNTRIKRKPRKIQSIAIVYWFGGLATMRKIFCMIFKPEQFDHTCLVRECKNKIRGLERWPSS